MQQTTYSHSLFFGLCLFAMLRIGANAYYLGEQRGWGLDTDADECSKGYGETLYSLDCLTSLWLEAGCLQSGLQAPYNAGSEQIKWWSARSIVSVRENMRTYFTHASNGNKRYKMLCFGDADNCNFQELKGHALYGYNDIVLPLTTLQECAQQCNAISEQCKSFDYNSNANLCMLSLSNRETAPEAIGVHRETDYYEKVCVGELTNPWNTNEPYSLGHVPGHILYEGGVCYMEYGPLGMAGNSAGTLFDDKDVAMRENITMISLRHGRRVNAIQLTYGDRRASRHGGSDGVEVNLSLDVDEFVTDVKVNIGDCAEKITFITNKRMLGPFGGNPFSIEYNILTNGKVLAYIAGGSGRCIDQLTFVFYC